MADDLTSELKSIREERAGISEKIETQRDNYADFCEDDEELNTTLGPIERDPEPYASGSIKVRPILRKYAQSLCERADLDVRLESVEEALRDIDLTPQKVKVDVKRYVAICEKKIASQQELCETLKKQNEQLTEVVRCIVTHPIFDNNFVRDKPIVHQYWGGLREPISLLSHSIQDGNQCAGKFLMDCGVQLDGKMIGQGCQEYPTSPLHYACMKDDFQSVDELITRGCDVNLAGIYPEKLPQRTAIIATFISTQYALGTPLQIASKMGSMEMVKFLMEKGAKIGSHQYQVYQLGLRVI